MISQARLKRKTHASPNGIASGLKRKREDDEETVDARVKRQYEYIQEGGGEALVVVNTRDFHRRPSSQPGPRTPQRRNTIAMGDLRSPPLVRDRTTGESEDTTRSSTRGARPPPPMRTTSLKTVTVGVTNEPGARVPGEIPVEGTMVQRWSSEQNPEESNENEMRSDVLVRPSSSNAVLESWYTSNNLSSDQGLAVEHGGNASNGPRKTSSSLSQYTNGFVTPENAASSGATKSNGLSANLAPGLRAALVSRLESCLIDLGSPADNMTLARCYPG